IILGATFDEGLEGTIRVSVVATGIDEAAMAAAQSFSESRRHEAPVSVPAPAPEPAPVEARPDPAAFASAIEESLSQPAPEPQMMASEPAPTMTDDVTIRPLPPRPVFNEPVQ